MSLTTREATRPNPRCVKGGEFRGRRAPNRPNRIGSHAVGTRRVLRWSHRSRNVASQSEPDPVRSEEHTSELQSPCNLVCRLLLEKKKKKKTEKQAKSVVT